MVICLKNESPHGNLKYSQYSFMLKSHSTILNPSLFFTCAFTERKFNTASPTSPPRKDIFFSLLYFIHQPQFPNSPLLQFPPPNSIILTPSTPSPSPFRWGKISLQNQQSLAYQVEEGSSSSPLHQG